jgi:hypothetical protein
VTRLATILCGLLAALTLTIADARAEKRVALVIGNSAYQNAGPLAAPVKDANAIAELFRKAGFDLVETRLDIGNLDLKTVARDFNAAARGADIAIVYFAGHGIEVNGTNYLLPVDAKLVSDFDVEDEALSLDRVMRAIEPAKRVRLVILDASRDNPFVRTMKRSVSAGNVGAGLAKVEPASAGTLVAFSAKPGATVAEGQGAFTAALLKALLVPGRDLRAALADVRDQVMQTTAGRQEPFIAGATGGAVAIAAGPTNPQAPNRQISVLPNPDAPQPPAAQQQFVADPQRDYEAAERIGTKEAWDAFLAVHPAGFYASLARAQRDKLAPPADAQAPSQVAVLPSPDKVEQEITIDPRAVASELQSELKRVGCDPGATDGSWSVKSRDALNQFNRRAGRDLDTGSPSVDALEAVRGQRGRICPLFCSGGQRADGDRCVAIPAAPPRPTKKAAAPPERPRKAEPPPRRAQPPREAVRRERIRPPTDREIFGGGGGRPAAPPISIGIGGRGVGFGVGF